MKIEPEPNGRGGSAQTGPHEPDGNSPDDLHQPGLPPSGGSKGHRPGHEIAQRKTGGANPRLPLAARGADPFQAVPGCQSALRDLCAAHPARGVALVETCPALAILLVQSWPIGRPAPSRAFCRTILEQPWRKILSVLGLPARPRTFKILCKVPAEHCHTPTVKKLGHVLRGGRCPWLHVLPHLRRITRDTVALLDVDPRIVSPKLLLASGESDHDDLAVTWTLGTVRSLRAEHEGTGAWPYAGVGYEELKRVEGKLQDRLFRQSLAPFPAPPFAGVPPALEPVHDYDRLLLETGEMNYYFPACLGEIIAARMYLYAVRSPERATIVLRRGAPGDAWAVHALCAAGNKKISEKTRALVLRWFSSVTSTSSRSTPNPNG